MIFIRLTTILYLLVHVQSMNLFSNSIIKTVPVLNITNFIGTWYQSGTSRSTKLFGTGIDYSQVKANYKCVDNCTSNVISILNEGFNTKGVYTNITGISYSIDNTIPSKRKVKFDTVPVIGNYWIVKLGPVLKNKYYKAPLYQILKNNKFPFSLNEKKGFSV